MRTLSGIGKHTSTPIRKEWIPIKDWQKAEAILEKIRHLKFTTKNGIFEYSLGKFDRGFLESNTSQFKNFIRRIIKERSKSIEKLEELF